MGVPNLWYVRSVFVISHFTGHLVQRSTKFFVFFFFQKVKMKQQTDPRTNVLGHLPDAVRACLGLQELSRL